MQISKEVIDMIEHNTEAVNRIDREIDRMMWMGLLFKVGVVVWLGVLSAVVWR